MICEKYFKNIIDTYKQSLKIFYDYDKIKKFSYLDYHVFNYKLDEYIFDPLFKINVMNFKLTPKQSLLICEVAKGMLLAKLKLNPAFADMHPETLKDYAEISDKLYNAIIESIPVGPFITKKVETPIESFSELKFYFYTRLKKIKKDTWNDITKFVDYKLQKFQEGLVIEVKK